MRRISRIFFLVLVQAVLLLLVTFQADTVLAQSESTPPPFPLPGRLVDVGGWRLHLNCTGEARASQPTVILEAGKGDFSVEWSLVQPGVAKFARVCSYDRAGDGWSDLGPHPRTFHQIVYELHLATGRPIPAVKVSNPLRVSDIPPSALSQMRVGMQVAVKTADDPPRDKLPTEAQRMRTWALGQLGHVAAAVNPFENEELAGLRAERAKSKYPLGDLPLIVLTRGIPEEESPDGKALEAEHRRDHEAIAAMSHQGKLVIATRSGHHIQLDEPELVIKSIREVLAAMRK